MNNVSEGHKNKQSYANTRTTGKEQYYTNSEVVDLCIAEVQRHIDLSDKTILEPAGGTGEFIEGFKRIGIEDKSIISYDIEPHHPLVKEGNYLETDLSSFDNLISITNPPFGRASSLAKKFFNHATGHSSYICYLVPKSWRKWTTHNSLDKNFHLIADIEMPKNCFYLSDGKTNKKDVLSTVFQIWERKDNKRPEIKIPDNKLIKKITPKMKEMTSHRVIKKTLFELIEGEYKEFETICYEKYKAKRPDYVVGANFEIIVFGHSCGKCKEITEPRVEAKTTTMYLKIDKEDVKDALRKIDFSKYYNNVAYVRALSIQEINYELNEWFGLDNFKFMRF
jgi:predicted RNA methylase